MADKDTDTAKYKIERFKNTVEYIKYITTLSTGSIVVIVTFIGKLTNGMAFRLAVVIAIAGFLSTVIFATVLYSFGLLFFHPGDEDAPSWLDATMGILMFLTFVSFLVAVTSLAFFAIANIS
jgi:multisubunit Na+/H+ antiporter MnhF subunit